VPSFRFGWFSTRCWWVLPVGRSWWRLRRALRCKQDVVDWSLRRGGSEVAGNAPRVRHGSRAQEGLDGAEHGRVRGGHRDRNGGAAGVGGIPERAGECPGCPGRCALGLVETKVGSAVRGGGSNGEAKLGLVVPTMETQGRVRRISGSPAKNSAVGACFRSTSLSGQSASSGVRRTKSTTSMASSCRGQLDPSRGDPRGFLRGESQAVPRIPRVDPGDATSAQGTAGVLA